MTTSLVISVNGQDWSFSPDQDVVIGRGDFADVRIDHKRVSRHHLDALFDGEAWLLRDRSSGGTWQGEERVEELVLTAAITLRLGARGGPDVTFAPDEQLSTPAIDLDPEAVRRSTIGLEDDALRLSLGDQHLAFNPGERVTVGRDESCNLRSDSRLVSGQHCAFEHDGEHWRIEDLDSTRGTFIDGRQISTPTRVQGAFFVGLGDPSAGEPLRVVTAGVHKPKPDTRTVMVAGAALAVALVAVILAVALWPSSDTGANSASQLAAAKAATVYIVTETGSGSGAFVTESLILTNRHVAEDKERIWISSAVAEDEPVVLRYAARPHAVHPYLDVMLLRVDSGARLDADGPVGNLPLPAGDPAVLEVGDSTSLRVGDEINALGFPAITSQVVLDEAGDVVLPVATVSQGEIVNFQLWPGCTNPAADDLLVPGGFSNCAPGGDLGRGNLVTADLSGSGGSGGPVVVEGELVAVRYAGQPPQVGDTSSTAGTASSIPTEYFLEWLQEQLTGA